MESKVVINFQNHVLLVYWGGVGVGAEINDRRKENLYQITDRSVGSISLLQYCQHTNHETCFTREKVV